MGEFQFILQVMGGGGKNLKFANFFLIPTPLEKRLFTIFIKFRGRKFQIVVMFQTWHWVQAWAQSTFLLLFLCGEQTSIKKTISNILLSTAITSNNTIYLFSKIKTVSARSFSIKPFSKQFKAFHFRTYHKFESWNRFGT